MSLTASGLDAIPFIFRQEIVTARMNIETRKHCLDNHTRVVGKRNKIGCNCKTVVVKKGDEK